MGDLGATAALISAGIGAAQTVSGIAQGNAQAKHQARQADLQRRQQQAERERQLKLLEADRKAQTARARAALGAAGVGSAEGSGAAVINQLNRRSDESRVNLLQGAAFDDEAFGLAVSQPRASGFDNLLEVGQSLSRFGSALDDWNKKNAKLDPNGNGQQKSKPTLQYLDYQ